jgi:hypothetical protein
MEIFKNITDYDRYAVSNIGRVINNETGKIMKPCLITSGYFCLTLCKNGKRKQVYVHRLVALVFLDNVENKQFVDHINNIKTDNRVENLRMATSNENNRNRGISKSNTSGIKGVYFRKSRNKWIAEIKIDGKKTHLGYFKNIEDATEARQKKALEIFGEYLNDCEK